MIRNRLSLLTVSTDGRTDEQKELIRKVGFALEKNRSTLDARGTQLLIYQGRFLRGTQNCQNAYGALISLLPIKVLQSID